MIYEFPDCGGCRTCELACSFHFSEVFNQKNSSIKIVENKEKNGFSIVFLEKKDGSLNQCDGCPNEDIPLCVQYCVKSETLKELINKFMKEKID